MSYYSIWQSCKLVETCSSCTNVGKIWCTNFRLPSELDGACTSTSPCASLFSQYTADIELPERCPGATPPKIGAANYCSELYRNTRTKCQLGAGGCQSNSECDEKREEFDSRAVRYTLQCRDPGVGVKVCCYPPKTPDSETLAQANARCTNEYNVRKAASP